ARFGLRSVEQQRVYLCFFGAATVLLIGLLGRRVAGPTTGLVAAGIAAIYPMLFQSDAVLMPETLFALLVTAVLLVAYEARDRPRLLAFGALGLLVGLAALTRSEALLLVALITLPLALTRPGGARQRALLAVVTVVATMVPIGVWAARNQATFHHFVPLSDNLGSAIDGANCPTAYYGPRTGQWFFSPECFEGF